jgi:hypothetical protein
VLRQPDIVGIQKRDKLTFGVADSQVSTRASAPVAVTIVLEVPYSLGMRTRPLDGHASALIGRAIIHQQQLPAGVGLSQDAGECVREETLCVEKRSHDRNQGRFSHWRGD